MSLNASRENFRIYRSEVRGLNAGLSTYPCLVRACVRVWLSVCVCASREGSDDIARLRRFILAVGPLAMTMSTKIPSSSSILSIDRMLRIML